jgi:hypothetical protein
MEFCLASGMRTGLCACTGGIRQEQSTCLIKIAQFRLYASTSYYIYTEARSLVSA